MKKTIENMVIDFPWFSKNKGWIYFDNAASSLKPKCVIKKIVEFYEKYSCNPHNNDSELTHNLNIKINNCRKNIASFFNADVEEIIFNSGSTEGLNLLAYNCEKLINKKEEMIISVIEHASNMLPWISVSKKIGFKINFLKEIPTIDNVLNLINEKTKIISLCILSNLFPFSINIDELVKKIKEKNKNIIVIFDATQYVSCNKLDVKKNNVDFFVCSAHKICGPTGIGILYGKKKLLDMIEPNKVGGGNGSEVTMENFKYVCVPNKFEAGTINSAGIIGFSEAITYINQIGIENIKKYLFMLKEYAVKKIKNNKNIEIYLPDVPSSIVLLKYKNVNAQDFANFLGRNKIIVRGGVSCVKLQHLITHQDDGFVRISFYFYNSKKEIDKLVKVLKNNDIFYGLF